MENVRVVFSTVIGDVSIVAKDFFFKVEEGFLSGKKEFSPDDVKAIVSIFKADAYKWCDGHKKYNVDFSVAVIGDIEQVRKQNEEYESKEDNGRHHVDLKSLEVREIMINGNNLRIKWSFVDCYGDKRLFSGFAYPLWEDYNDENHEDFHCSLPIKLKVYF